MIGFRASPTVAAHQPQQQQPNQANQMTTGATSGGDAHSPSREHETHQLPQQHCQQQQQRLSLLTNQHQNQNPNQAGPEQPEQTKARAIASSSSPSPTSGHHHHKSSPAGRRVSSPGYHSAASSPGSSVSSLVSSSASSSASSSGVSSAASDHHLQHRPISSPTCSMSLTSSSSLSSSAGNAMMLTPITTMAQLSSNQRHVGATNESEQQLAAAVAAAQAISCATAKLTSGPAQISLSSVMGIPSAHLNQHAHSNQEQQSRQTSHLSQQRPSGQQPLHVQHQQQQLHGSSQPNLLDYYPEAQQDGLSLSWFHGANSRQALSRALASDRAIVAGDISLAELSRYPVPIMARPPLGVSDLTLENWLSDVIQARKGIKLTFTSTRTVEPAFRVLARHAEHLKGPIILSADILTRPASAQAGKLGASKQQTPQQQQQQQPVDAWTFLMLCRTRFPKSIISIGWCSAGSSQLTSPSGESIVIQQADSSTAAESMFELDMMMDGQQQRQQQQHTANNNNNFNQPLLHITPATFNQRPNFSSLNVVQQLAAVAAAAAANNSNDHHRLSVPTSNQTPGQRSQHGYNLSSTGSMNSSSGNSSGSPSPTSPVGHILMSAAHQQQQQQQQQQQHQQAQQLLSQRHHQEIQRHFQAHQGHLHGQQRPSSAEQLMFAAAAAAAAAAASSTTDGKTNSSLGHAMKQPAPHQQMVGWPAVAAMVAASASFNEGAGSARNEADSDEENDDDDGQLPLNLNINEADPQHASQTLNELAAKIKSLQQETNDLGNSMAASTGSSQSIVHQLSLAGKLFSVGEAVGQHQFGQHHYQSNQSNNNNNNNNNNKWEHINKKAALANRLNSNSPSPVSASPKHQHPLQHGQEQHSQQNNLLCVKPAGNSLANLAAAQQKQQQLIQVKQEARQQPGYTREMIDKMASLVKEYNLTQPITFPVEARLLSRNNSSLAELQRLLYQVGSNSTLTIVAQPEDLISVDDLLTIRKHFATNQILFDLPDELTASLRHELDLL